MPHLIILFANRIFGYHALFEFQSQYARDPTLMSLLIPTIAYLPPLGAFGIVVVVWRSLLLIHQSISAACARGRGMIAFAG